MSDETSGRDLVVQGAAQGMFSQAALSRLFLVLQRKGLLSDDELLGIVDGAREDVSIQIDGHPGESLEDLVKKWGGRLGE